ncbi:MAG TPA: hypothetical protein VIZ43_31210, partial [Trebonia sp.]
GLVTSSSLIAGVGGAHGAVGYPVLQASLAISGVAAFAGGAAVARLTGRSMLLGGLRQFTAAFLATAAALLIGHAVGGHIA